MLNLDTYAIVLDYNGNVFLHWLVFGVIRENRNKNDLLLGLTHKTKKESKGSANSLGLLNGSMSKFLQEQGQHYPKKIIGLIRSTPDCIYHIVCLSISVLLLVV